MEPFPDFPETEISSGASDNRGHLWIDDTARGLSAGVWESEANLGRWMPWPVHEFMIILEGEVVMIEENGETVIGPEESFFIPKGRHCVWNQSCYAKKFFMIFDDTSGLSADASTPILKLDPQQLHQYFEDATGQLTVGVRETMGRRRDLDRSLSHELIHVLEGDVDVTDEEGGAQTFTAGDVFFVPFGATNSWESEGTLRAVYCAFTPRSDTP